MRQMTKISPKFFGHLHNHSFEANVYVHCNMYTRPHLTGKQQTFKSPLYQFHCHLHSLSWTPPERSYSWRSLSLDQQQEKSSSQLQQRQVAKRWWAGLLSLESLLYHTNITVLNIGKGNNINNQKQNWKGDLGFKRETVCVCVGGGVVWGEGRKVAALQHTDSLLASNSTNLSNSSFCCLHSLSRFADPISYLLAEHQME